MINYISSWSRQVILSVLIAIILEMILIKDSKNSKYIKTLIGIYIMYIIITPGLDFLKSEKIDFSDTKYDKYFSESNMYQKFETNIKEINPINMKETYELNLKQDIEEKLREKGYIVSNIKLKINMESMSARYGEIEEIEISLSKKNKNERKNTENQNMINVEEIKVKVNDNNIEENIENDELLTFLSLEYGIDINSIFIKGG